MTFFKAKYIPKMITDVINLIVLLIALYWIFDNYSYLPEYYINRYFRYHSLNLQPSNRRNLLLLSSSSMQTFGTRDHLGYARPIIKKFLAPHKVTEILFITYASPNIKGGVNTHFADNFMRENVVPSFAKLGITVKLLDINSPASNQQEEIRTAQAVYMSGGNTFLLTQSLHKFGVLPILRERISTGMPYMSASAGTNITSPTMQTTNDMPIICLDSCETLNVIPFQINVHYNNFNIGRGFAGESREQRITEYLQEHRTFGRTNKPTFVLGLREGGILHVSGDTAELVGLGSRKAVLLKLESDTLVARDISIGTRVDKLLELDAGGI